MKVTALIPDQLIQEVRQISGEKTITDALIVALKAWTSIEKIKRLNLIVDKEPLEFCAGYSATSIRKLNRRNFKK